MHINRSMDNWNWTWSTSSTIGDLNKYWRRGCTSAEERYPAGWRRRPRRPDTNSSTKAAVARTTTIGKQFYANYGRGDSSFEQNETATRTRASSSTYKADGEARHAEVDDEQDALAPPRRQRHDDAPGHRNICNHILPRYVHTGAINGPEGSEARARARHGDQPGLRLLAVERRRRIQRYGAASSASVPGTKDLCRRRRGSRGAGRGDRGRRAYARRSHGQRTNDTENAANTHKAAARTGRPTATTTDFSTRT